MHQWKNAGPVEVKLEGDAGQFVARIAVFNQIDKDGDVTLPGAFEDGAAVKIAAWGHNWGALAVGRGVIETDDEAARVRGQFFLNTDGGKQTYETVKALADLQEWSYGYEPTEVSFGEFEDQDVRFLRKLRVFEASPVLVGAGNDTGTEALKAAALPFADHALAVIAHEATFQERARARADMRERKEGRPLSAANRRVLTDHIAGLRTMAGELEGFLTDLDAPKVAPALRAAALRQLAEIAALTP